RLLARSWRRDGVLAQLDLRLALEHGPARRRNRPAAVSGDFERQQACRVKLAEDRAPFVAAELLADAEGRQGVVTEILDGLGFVPEEEVDQMLGAEPFAGAYDRRHGLLRGDGAVDDGDAAVADVAIAAGRRDGLAEVAEQRLTPAARRFAQCHQGIETQPVDQ